MSAEVSDVHAVHAEAERRNEEIVYALTDEPAECAVSSCGIRVESWSTYSRPSGS